MDRRFERWDEGTSYGCIAHSSGNTDLARNHNTLDDRETSDDESEDFGTRFYRIDELGATDDHKPFKQNLERKISISQEKRMDANQQMLEEKKKRLVNEDTKPKKRRQRKRKPKHTILMNSAHEDFETLQKRACAPKMKPIGHIEDVEIDIRECRPESRQYVMDPPKRYFTYANPYYDPKRDYIYRYDKY